jgi:hypothetical protein
MCRRHSHHCKVFCVKSFVCSLRTPFLIHSRCCRRQDAFARKSRERAGSDAVGTGSSDALPKMEQQVRRTFSSYRCRSCLRFAVQVRLDVEEVCRGWATLGLVTNDLAGIIKLRACVPIDSL